eukprot:4931004-Ditylum_brightwellii.AAC.1
MAKMLGKLVVNFVLPLKSWKQNPFKIINPAEGRYFELREATKWVKVQLRGYNTDGGGKRVNSPAIAVVVTIFYMSALMLKVVVLNKQEHAQSSRLLKIKSQASLSLM